MILAVSVIDDASFACVWQVLRALDCSVRFQMVVACDHIVMVDTGMNCELSFGRTAFI